MKPSTHLDEAKTNNVKQNKHHTQSISYMFIYF